MFFACVLTLAMDAPMFRRHKILFEFGGCVTRADGLLGSCAVTKAKLAVDGY